MLEILVVLAIIGLLATLAIVNIGQAHNNASAATARIMVDESLKAALYAFRLREGSFPSTSEGLDALRKAPSNRPNWGGPYVDKIPQDPWGEPYRYEYPGKHNKSGYDAWSAGPDKISGTDDDIGNWEKAATSP